MARMNILPGSQSGVCLLSSAHWALPHPAFIVAGPRITEVSLWCDTSLPDPESSSGLTGRHSARAIRPSWQMPLMQLHITHLYLIECALFSCHGASDFSVRNNIVVTSRILCKNGRFHRDAGRPVLLKNRPLYDPLLISGS